MGRFDRIEAELNKQLDLPYQWGRKQGDAWDNKTNFIYDLWKFDAIQKELQEKFPNDAETHNYARARWFNFWSARSVEAIFQESPRVKAASNAKDRLKDFFIDGIPFDHKTTVYPYTFNQPLHFAIENPEDLVHWLYENQSQGKRMHWGNRLFLVMHNRRGPNWKLKSRISWLQGIIHGYLDNFDSKNLIKLKSPTGEEVLSDLLWCIAEE